MQELEEGRTKVLQTSHQGETSGFPRGAACSLCPADAFIFPSAQQVYQSKCHDLGRKMDREAMVRKVNSQLRACRQETIPFTLPPPCLIHSTGATTSVWESLVFLCSASNGKHMAGFHEQRPLLVQTHTWGTCSEARSNTNGGL